MNRRNNSLRSKRLRGQNRKSPSSVFLCSETKRKRLLRRLGQQMRIQILILGFKGLSNGRLRVVPHFSSGIVERAKRERA